MYLILFIFSEKGSFAQIIMKIRYFLCRNGNLCAVEIDLNRINVDNEKY